MRKQIVLTILVVICFGAGPKQAPPDPLIAQASDAVAAGELASFVTSVQQELEPILVQLNQADQDQLTHLVALREFGQYFGRIKTKDLDSDQQQTLQWLADEPKLLNTLMMAISDDDAPDRVLAVLTALHADQKNRLEDFPDLTTAICVVWDAPAQRNDDDGKLAVARAVRLMRYYSRQNFRFNLQKLPWKLATYVVDNVVSEDEIAWALQRYSGRQAIGGIYFDVPYDYDSFYGTSNDPNKKDRAHTLQNLVRFGGVCIDQAYFATQVARSLGIPATICTGQGGTGEVGHAWVGYLDLSGDSLAWNFSEGRYAEYQFWKGEVDDPQTRHSTTEADVSMLAELGRSSQRDRLASDALCKVADMFDKTRRADIYMKAVNLSPGNSRAWQGLAELGATLDLTDRQRNNLKAALEKFAVRQYPDFALAILMRSISGCENMQQERALEQMQTMFDRPDIKTQIRLAQGDLAMREKRPGDAMFAYGQVLNLYGSSGPLVLETMQHVDTLLHETGNLNLLSTIYRDAWQHLPQPEGSAYVKSTPFYILGMRYKELLVEAADARDAQAVQNRLDSLTAAADSHDAAGK
jgi:hypothetical protein